MSVPEWILCEMISAEASLVLGGGQPADRAELHRWVRERLRETRRAVRQYRRMERRYRKAVMKARRVQQREHVEQRLAGMPVEELVRGARVNTAALHNGGVTTAADVNQRTVDDLERIDGIGPKSAPKIKDLAAQFARIRPDDLRPPGNPDAWKAGDYAIARGLAALSLVTALAPHVALLRQALGTMRGFTRATSWLAWLLSPSTRKARIRSEAPGIRQTWVTSQAAGSLQRLLSGLGQARQAVTEPDSALAGRWRRSSSSLLALLEQLLATRGAGHSPPWPGHEVLRGSCEPDPVHHTEHGASRLAAPSVPGVRCEVCGRRGPGLAW
jgi:hypothetical protein